MFTPYVQSTAYMHDNMSQFQSIEEIATHFEYAVDDMSHQGVPYHEGGYIDGGVTLEAIIQIEQYIEE